MRCLGGTGSAPFSMFGVIFPMIRTFRSLRNGDFLSSAHILHDVETCPLTSFRSDTMLLFFFFLSFLAFRSSHISCATISQLPNLSLNLSDPVDSYHLASVVEPPWNKSTLEAESRQAGKCGRPYRWMNSLFRPLDCEGALDWLFLEEMANESQWVTYEFLSQHVKKKTKFKLQQTPRKYTFCTFRPNFL